MKSEHYSFVGGIKGDVKSNFLIHTKYYKTSLKTINAFYKIISKEFERNDVRALRSLPRWN